MVVMMIMVVMMVVVIIIDVIIMVMVIVDVIMMVMVIMMSMTTMRTSEVKLRNPKSFWDFEGVHLQHRVETVAASKAAA